MMLSLEHTDTPEHANAFLPFPCVVTRIKPRNWTTLHCTSNLSCLSENPEWGMGFLHNITAPVHTSAFLQTRAAQNHIKNSSSLGKWISVCVEPCNTK